MANKENIISESQTNQKHKFCADSEARNYLGGCSRGFLWGLRKEGKIKFYKIGTSIRYKYEDLDEFMQSHLRNKEVAS